jgi:hypothetical protein
MNQRRECPGADLGGETQRITPKPFGRPHYHGHGRFVPEGHSTIAQRFNAGWESIVAQVPKGRPNFSPILPSLRDLLSSVDRFPSVSISTLGYFHSSLRESGKISKAAGRYTHFNLLSSTFDKDPT